MAPRKTEEGVKNPIVFLIHGYGADEYDLFGSAAALPSHYHIVSPRGTIELPGGGAAWYDLVFDADGNKKSNIEQALKSRDALAEFIKKAVEKYDADPKDVVVLGFSQGAILSYGLMSKYPELAQRYIPISGYILQDIIEPIKDKNAFKKFDVLAMHGTLDNIIEFELGEKVQDFLKERDIKHYFFSFPIGHGISSEEFYQIQNFLM